MKKRNFISAILSLSMLASAFSMTAAVHAEETTEEPKFSEVFDSTTTVYGDYTTLDNAITLWDHKNTVIAKNSSGAEWVTSSLIGTRASGMSTNANKVFRAYVSPKTDETDGYIAVRGMWNGCYGSVKLRLPEKLWTVKKMTFRTKTNAKSGGVKLFLSGDEKDYLLAGRWIYENSAQVNDAVQYAPFAAKIINSKGDTQTTPYKTTNLSNGQGWTNADAAADWTVEVQSDYSVKISAQGIDANGDATTSSFTYTVLAQTAKNMVVNCAYPLAVFHTDEMGETQLSNVKIWYDTAETPTFYDDFEDVSDYKTAVTEKTLLTNVDEKTIAEHKTGEKWTTSKVQTGYYSLSKEYAKANLNNGNLRVNGWGNTYMAAVNLNLGKIKTINRLRFTVRHGVKGGGVLLFKSADEKNYLLFGQKRGYIPTAADAEGVTNYSPVINYLCNSTNNAEDLSKSTPLQFGKESDGWTANDMCITWDVTVNSDYSLTVTAAGNGGGYSTFELKDDVVKSIVKACSYPIAVYDNDNNTETTIDNVAVWYTPYEEPMFDFTAMDINSIDIDFGSKQVITQDTATGAKWYSSEVFCGAGDYKRWYNDKEDDLKGGAKQDNGLRLSARYQTDLTANLDYEFKDLNRIVVTTGGPGQQTGFRFMVSEDEKSYYELRFGRQEDNKDASLAATKRSHGSPTFAKFVNGAEVEGSRTYCDAVWGNTGSDYEWTVKIDGNKININVVSGDKTWSHTYTDENLSDMMKASRYPVALLVCGDGSSVFKDVSVYGTPLCAPVTVADDKVIATIEDGVYGSTDIHEVIAFYDNAGNMLKSETLTSSGTARVQQTYDLDNAASVKAFVFNGDPQNGDLLNAVSYENELSEKSDDPIKVACVGDSLTEGNGSTNADTKSYPAQLQRMLGRGYEVKNFGKGSRTVLPYELVTTVGETTTTEQLQYTQFTGKYGGMKFYNAPESMIKGAYADSKEYAADIVVIQLGTNDIIYNTVDGTDAFKTVYKNMIDEYKAANENAEIFVVVPPILNDTAKNENISKYIKPVLEDLAKTDGVKMINMQNGPTAEMQKDGVHFNDAGYAVMAQKVYDAVKNKVTYTYGDGKINITPSASIYGDVVKATFNDSGLSGIEMYGDGKAFIQPNTATSIDVSGLTGEVKVMAWDGLATMKPLAEMGKKAASYGVAVSGDTTVVTGKTEPNAGVVITAYDSNGKLIYVNNVLTDYNSDYSFTFSGAAETVYINGEKAVK